MSQYVRFLDRSTYFERLFSSYGFIVPRIGKSQSKRRNVLDVDLRKAELNEVVAHFNPLKVQQSLDAAPGCQQLLQKPQSRPSFKSKFGQLGSTLRRDATHQRGNIQAGGVLRR